MSTISAGNTTTTSLIVTGDTTGNLTFITQGGANTITVPNVTGTMVTTGSSNVVTQTMLSTNVAGNGPAFSVYGSALVSAAQNTFVKITYDTKDFDTANCFASSRFTPNVAGYYQFSISIIQSGASAGQLVVAIYKNGSRYTDSPPAPIVATIDSGVFLGILVYLNGSTDYAEVYAYQSGAATVGIGSNNYLRKFTGFLARAA